MKKSRSKGEGTIYKEGSKFYFKVRIDGKAKTSLLRNDDNTPCKTMTEATKSADGLKAILFATTKEEIATHIASAKKIIKEKNSILLSDIWQKYLDNPNRPESGQSTLKGHKSSLDIFVEWIRKNKKGITKVSQLDADMIKDFFTYRLSTGIANRTYNATLVSLRLIFKYILNESGLEYNFFNDIKKRTIETESREEFTQEQVIAIFKGFETGFFYETTFEQLTKGRERKRFTKTLEYKPLYKDEMETLLNLCCWTGCRGQDGCLMEWHNINFKSNTISYKPRKTAKKTGGKVVTLPIHPQLKEALIKAMSWRDNDINNDYILPNVAGRYMRNASGIQKDVMKIIHIATGLETKKSNTYGRRKTQANRYSLHIFRHSFVSFCANAGVPLAIVAEIVGHGSPAMTNHYSHISNNAKQQAINSLPSFGAIEPHATPRQELIALLESMPIEKINKLLTIAREI